MVEVRSSNPGDAGPTGIAYRLDLNIGPPTGVSSEALGVASRASRTIPNWKVTASSGRWFSLNFHLPAPEATSRSKLTKVNTLERPKQVRTWTRQSGTALGSQAATAPPELHDDLVGEDFSCLKYSGNSGNPIIRAETLLYPPRRLQGTTPWTRAAIRG